MDIVIDTSTLMGGVGVSQEGRLLRLESWYSPRSHTAELMPAVQWILSQRKSHGDAITSVVVAHGPGRFGSLRAGMSVAKGLAFAYGVPLIGISTLEASANVLRSLNAPICSMVGAGRDFVSWAEFLSDGRECNRNTTETVNRIGEVLTNRSESTIIAFSPSGGADPVLETIEDSSLKVFWISAPERLEQLAYLGWRKLEQGAIEPIQPHYLRPPSINSPRQRKEPQ